MAKPVIAIVGRPNVGKSTLFNKLAGERIAIVEDIPGVTRDRIYHEIEWRGKTCLMIDTGGIEPKTDDIILKHMRTQAELAIESADVIIFMCDIHSGGAPMRSILFTATTTGVRERRSIFAISLSLAVTPE